MNVKILLVGLLGTLACVQARITMTDIQEAEWESFKVKYNKNYENESVDSFRKQVFLDNKLIIDEHNKRWADGKESYEMGVNEFTDLLEKEFHSLFDELDENVDYAEKDLNEAGDTELSFKDDNNELEDSEYDTKLPDHIVDWRTLKAVTSVRNQGHFNNSWAFAAAGVVESRQFIEKGKLVELSKQNLIDCSTSKKLRTKNALEYIVKMKGINTEKVYPYRGVKGVCRFNRRKIGATIKKYFQCPRNEKKLAKIVDNGPVAAVISIDAIRFYTRGVFNNANCSKNPSFGVLIVGYGSCSNCGEYWILKTPLGKDWGDKGYLKLARNRQNLCGIASRAYYPTFK